MSWFAPSGTAPRPSELTRHPYYPQEVPIPGYYPNVTPLPVLLASFGSIIAIILVSTLVLARRTNPSLSLSDQLLFCWFVLCGSLHCFFEGYFVLNHRHLASSQTLLGQVWKEYALSDSRYLTSDPFTLCVEAITVLVWGPLCFAAAACIAKGSNIRYPIQIVLSTAHLYGVALYYATCYVEKQYRGVSYSRPEALYFFGYFIGMNAPWVFVPLFILSKSLARIRQVFAVFERVDMALLMGFRAHEGVESKKSR